VAKFFKLHNVEIAHVTLTTSSLGTLTYHKTKLRMDDPCTKFEVYSVSHCGDITWGVKFPDHAPFREDFSSAEWDLLWKINAPNLKFTRYELRKLRMAVQNAEKGVVSGG